MSRNAAVAAGWSCTVPGSRRAKADPRSSRLIGLLREPTNGSDDRGEIAIVASDLSLQFRKPRRDLPVYHRQLTKSREHSDDKDAHLDGPGAVQYRRGHDRAVLGERPGKSRRELEVTEVVTSCDHLGSFGFGQPESKIWREASRITANSLIESLGRNSVDRSQVGIQQHLLAADRQDPRIDRRRGEWYRKALVSCTLHWQMDPGTFCLGTLNSRSTRLNGALPAPRGESIPWLR